MRDLTNLEVVSRRITIQTTTLQVAATATTTATTKVAPMLVATRSQHSVVQVDITIMLLLIKPVQVVTVLNSNRPPSPPLLIQLGIEMTSHQPPQVETTHTHSVIRIN